MNFAKTDIIKKDNCYLVEGYLDVIALHQSGISTLLHHQESQLQLSKLD